MTGKAHKKFSSDLYGLITEARGIEGDAVPTPEANQVRNDWIRAAARGRRSSSWVEEDDPMSESHRQMNQFLRSAFPRDEDS
jgi:hypothetical protein